MVLEGNELEEAFRKTLGGEVGLVVEEKPGTDPLDPRTSSSFRQEEQRFLEKDLELIDEEREALLAMRTVLRNQTAEVRKKKAAVQRMAGAAEKELAKARAQCSAASKLVDEQLEKIAKTANAIQDFYGPGGSRGTNQLPKRSLLVLSGTSSIPLPLFALSFCRSFVLRPRIDSLVRLRSLKAHTLLCRQEELALHLSDQRLCPRRP